MSRAADLPDRLEISGTTFARVESPGTLACWTATAGPADDLPPVSVVMEPAAAPDQRASDLAAVVLARFGELADVGADYLRHRLREPGFGLSGAELGMLDAAGPPFAEPAAVVWADGTWLLRFAESDLAMADPYGIGVLFEGTVPSGVEDLSEADLL
ncbi:hypothetical protein [Promicromonospora sp. MEB111]|uniref:hypothetical protein n=1 Tax=Promicromonospora sp. MEB111 TaxID=3040301 RepID=UPI00254E241E|nr:hypothetical protein [Promicromonospora sp. MEB111]